MSAEPVLEAHDLAKRYGRRTWALTGSAILGALAVAGGGLATLVVRRRRP